MTDTGTRTGQTVLVVEDEQPLLRALEINLRARGYRVLPAPDARTGLARAAGESPDLVVLDLGLPDFSGFEVIEGLRGWTEVPIVVLSGRDASSSKVAALDAGADDYVTKPFAVEELLARLRAVARRTRGEPPAAAVSFGGVSVDLARREARRNDGEPVRLTPTEWSLLEHLLRHAGKLLSAAALVRDVWGDAPAKDTGSLRVHMANLRRKLEADPARPRHLLTEPGLGYRFVP